MVSLTHGEGFGRPLLEATMTGLPVIASGWSGQLDFLDGENSLLMGGELKPIPKSVEWKDILVSGSEWFVVNETQVYKSLNYVFENYDEVKLKGKKLMDKNRKKFTLSNMTKKLDEIIETHLKDVPQQVGLQLPKLKKVGDDKSELPKINLPKLKKIKTEGVSV